MPKKLNKHYVSLKFQCF